ncbi:hypothetical protein OQA88_5415 [Cercophora sp. LCS_1]
MQLSSFLGAIALLSSSALASPVQTEQELVARQHYTANATVTGFHVLRNATHINYSASIQVHPEDDAVKFTLATNGTKVPETSGFWDSEDPKLYFRFNRVTLANNAVNYRLLLSDAHKTGSVINLDYFSPADDWEGKYRTVYTGPAKFTLV